ncbi:hypothetical protein BO83DRAFT_124949 [Aspergillus eucalypticola CBS 122712]|uniref:Uncharacterized protein n=1 Tax=Aspergillus eucalypticola (strain CBS 122712 / IBT 29274) TaxID=1448314 RepID=A0A317UT21_ASPEC|nr:uncharacterized protein BO83DRAFT_124949 [Aspergillus eucalypticola CBS 122712]PWY65203.1 hypothetical protein BO83DRAFT_124949 [Aspergillus eucalypticola CBS 122712]
MIYARSSCVRRLCLRLHKLDITRWRLTLLLHVLVKCEADRTTIYSMYVGRTMISMQHYVQICYAAPPGLLQSICDIMKWHTSSSDQ